jgi:hypothetical protein
LLSEFNAKAGKEDVFEPTFEKENLHGSSCSNGVESCELATSENLIVMSTVFPVATSIHSLGHILMEIQAIRLTRF